MLTKLLSSQSIVFFILFNISSISIVKAQALTDVTAAFNLIDSKPTVFHLKKNPFKIPAGGHLQGIQAVGDSEIVITASSASFSYFITATLNMQTGKGKINDLQKIWNSPYRHAGGCQVNKDILIAGIEDNQQKDKSRIVMVSFSDTLDTRYAETGYYHISTIIERGGTVKRSTAGAVGFTKIKSGQYLVAVGDWDSRNIDFYLSKPWSGQLTDFYLTKSWSGQLFDSLTTFTAVKNKKWPSYQSINLLCDTNGTIYLVGFALDGLNNRADLFEVSVKNEAAYLRPVTTRNFKCKGGAGFRYGSGICVTPTGQLSIYSCGRNVSAHTPINIFR